MSLAPDQIARRFDELVEMGRARLPGLAPEWTDHNAHDPGITLMELLAWVAEAQLYSLGHTRRDERAAFAALLGIAAAGTQAARGLIWPDRLDPHAPALTYAQSLVIPADAVVNMLDAETPTFRPAARLLWVAGRIRKLETRLADGRTIDHTAINERGGPAFLPFGDRAGSRDVLALEFECRSDRGIFPAKREDAVGAYWSLGVRAEAAVAGDSPAVDPDTAPCNSPLSAALVTDTERYPLHVVSDSSHGLLQTGVLLLDLSAVTGSPQRFTIELRAQQGFDRPPRVQRIAPNALPIVQGRSIQNELHVATGLPDWTFQLDVPGLRFAASETPVRVEVDDVDGRTEWRRCNRLSEHGPNDRVHEFDATSDRITFGNGINGRRPAAQAQVFVSYAVSDGELGNVARNRKWRVTGFVGSFGVNPDAVTGGAAPMGSIDQRRTARRRAREEHALVSSSDVVAAALKLPLLEVARAWVLNPPDKLPRTGAVTLVAMRARTASEESGRPETRRWLEAIRRALVPKMPLGARLVVRGPRYIDFAIRATLEVVAGRDPGRIRDAVESVLRGRLALVKDAGRTDPRRPGVPVTSRDVAAWMRSVEGVRDVADLRLVLESGEEVAEVVTPRNGLPRFNLAASTIEVKRPAPGVAP